jgi:hypothetical protein
MCLNIFMSCVRPTYSSSVILTKHTKMSTCQNTGKRMDSSKVWRSLTYFEKTKKISKFAFMNKVTGD